MFNNPPKREARCFTKHTRRPRCPQQRDWVRCTRCSLKGHTAGECRCTVDKECHKYGQMGHFTVMCRSNKKKLQTQKNRLSVHRPVRYVTEPAEQSDNSVDDYAFMMKPHSGMLTVIIAEEPFDIIIDSGASCNIINSTVAAKPREQGEIFESCRRNIYPYGLAPIVARHFATCGVCIGNNSNMVSHQIKRRWMI